MGSKANIIIGLIAVILIIISVNINYNNEDNLENEFGLIEVESEEQLFKLLDKQEQNSLDNYNSNLRTFNTFAESGEFLSDSVSDFGSDDIIREVSKTNTQYETVDEADFFKNDDNYVYFIHENKLRVYGIFEPFEEITTLELPERLHYTNANMKDIFIHNNKLILISNTYKLIYEFAKHDIEPTYNYDPVTMIQTYDISDKSKPSLEDEYIMSGNYYTSRLVNDNVYILAQQPLTKNSIRPYYIREEERIFSGIVYEPNGNNYYYNNILSIDINNGEVSEESFLLSYTNTLMMSENAIYIAQADREYYNGYKRERFDEIIYPELPSELKDQIDKITETDDDKRWVKINSILSDYITKKDIASEEMTDEQLEKELDFFKKINEKLKVYDYEQKLKQTETKVHKISVEGLDINYIGFAKVHGDLNNQFAMDQYGNDFRIATTVNIWSDEITRYNNVYKFDKDLNLIGSLEKIGINESIFSSRFIGDKLYLVTFERTDPFFVIDLSDKPEILGELKITGYSSYLHPLENDRILGIGKEATEDGREEGLKLAIFDISDLNNPVLVDKEVIGERGSNSPLLNDHKAVTFYKNKMILPLSIVEKITPINEYSYDYQIWSGAHVYDLENGLDLLGKIKHSRSSDYYFSYYNDANVKRSAIFDSFIVTLSNKFLKINYLPEVEDETNYIKELEAFKLPSNYNPYYYDEYK